MYTLNALETSGIIAFTFVTFTMIDVTALTSSNADAAQSRLTTATIQVLNQDSYTAIR